MRPSFFGHALVVGAALPCGGFRNCESPPFRTTDRRRMIPPKEPE